jgi:hypothetical protein
MEKYYTPTIEEFYPGFEYEDQVMSYCGSSVEWKKTIFTTSDSVIDLFKGSPNDWYELPRVKHLDKEDIESLGFVYDHTNKDLVDKFLELGYTDDDSRDRQWVFYKSNLCLFYYPKSKELGTFTRDPSKSHFMMKYSRDNHMISTLIVKNKSELKKILKQLEIL